MSDYHALGGTIRKFWPGELGALRDHMLRLDPEARRMRFAGLVSDHFIEGYCETARRLGTVIYGYFIDGVPVAAGELRSLFDTFPLEAEVALTVETAYRDMGLGSALMGRIIRAARNRHVGKLHMICLIENVRMQQIARKYQARLSFSQGTITGELDPPYPSPLTLWLEGLDESDGFVSAVIDAIPTQRGEL
jgi:GNAT superfamily N-acetyltransferase